jgi:ATP-binding cassette subfamily G (WHITE) protein 2 (PDR)
MLSNSSLNSPAKAGKTSVGPEEQEILRLPANNAHHEPNTFDYRTELKNVATEMSRARTASTFAARETISRPDTLAVVEPEDPALDPTSQHFDVYKWVKAVLRAADKANVKFRRASFCFKNLDVSGSGSAVNFQSNVASVFMIPFRLREYVTFGKRPEKRILHCFKGVVKSGEMLLVLGRPGSGCSTFLKTIAGELRGLKRGITSVLHYNGIAILRGHLQMFFTDKNKAYLKWR